MTVSYFVRYDIDVPDVAAFVRRYREAHVPLVSRWPGLRRGKAVLMAQFEFDSEEAMNRAFASPERAAARQDFKRFMTFEGTVTHQAMESAEVWRSAK